MSRLFNWSILRGQTPHLVRPFYTSCLDFGAIFDCHANDVFWVIISGTLVGVKRSPVQASVEEVFTDVFCSNSKAKQLLIVHSNLQYNAVSQQSLWIITRVSMQFKAAQTTHAMLPCNGVQLSNFFQFNHMTKRTNVPKRPCFSSI